MVGGMLIFFVALRIYFDLKVLSVNVKDGNGFVLDAYHRREKGTKGMTMITSCHLRQRQHRRKQSPGMG